MQAATKFASMTVALPVAPFVVIHSVVAVPMGVAGSLAFSACAAMISMFLLQLLPFNARFLRGKLVVAEG